MNGGRGVTVNCLGLREDNKSNIFGKRGGALTVKRMGSINAIFGRRYKTTNKKASCNRN